MSKLENDAMTQLLSSISEKKIESSLNPKKKKCISNEKHFCTAAVRYITIGDAYKDKLKKINVCLVEEEKNGIVKQYTYARCSKPTPDSVDFCHLHNRMLKHNSEGLKIFEKDIVPHSTNDKHKWEKYFENMGKRGAKKKNCDNNFSFSDENHPILMILNHKNPKLETQLSLYASQLLKSNYTTNSLPPDIIKEKTIPAQIVEKKNDNLSNLMTLISSIKKDEDASEDDASEDDASEDDESEGDDESEDDDESEEEETKKNNQEKSIMKTSDEASDDSEDSESEKDTESDDDVQVIEIYSTSGKLLYYDEENNSVIEPEGNDSGEVIGTLEEISKEYHTVEYNKKYFIVAKELKHNEKGKIYRCVLTNKVFNKKMKLIGTCTKLKNKDYRFDFT
jgi:hypothetical protein